MNTTCNSARFVLGVFLAMVARAPVSGVVRADDRPKRIEDVFYAQPAGTEQKADVYLPSGNGPFPAVLVVHGGGWRSGGKSQLRFVAERLAMQDYVAVAITYRLAPEHKFPAQVDDCLTAVRWMREHADEYKIDPDRVGAWGYSAGGHLVSMLGAVDSSAGFSGSGEGNEKVSTRLQAVVAGGAPCDFRLVPEENDRLVFWLGATRGEQPALYERASPVSYVTRDDPPVFFYHGDADETVPLESPRVMEKALQSVSVPTDFHLIPAASHIKAVFDQAAAVKAMEFLDRHLKNRTATTAP